MYRRMQARGFRLKSLLSISQSLPTPHLRPKEGSQERMSNRLKIRFVLEQSEKGHITRCYSHVYEST